jgi:hypothetical protein
MHKSYAKKRVLTKTRRRHALPTSYWPRKTKSPRERRVVLLDEFQRIGRKYNGLEIPPHAKFNRPRAGAKRGQLKSESILAGQLHETRVISLYNRCDMNFSTARNHKRQVEGIDSSGAEIGFFGAGRPVRPGHIQAVIVSQSAPFTVLLKFDFDELCRTMDGNTTARISDLHADIFCDGTGFRERRREMGVLGRELRNVFSLEGQLPGELPFQLDMQTHDNCDCSQQWQHYRERVGDHFGRGVA